MRGLFPGSFCVYSEYGEGFSFFISAYEEFYWKDLRQEKHNRRDKTDT
jgi:hypothetical protein